MITDLECTFQSMVHIHSKMVNLATQMISQCFPYLFPQQFSLRGIKCNKLKFIENGAVATWIIWKIYFFDGLKDLYSNIVMLESMPLSYHNFGCMQDQFPSPIPRIGIISVPGNMNRGYNSMKRSPLLRTMYRREGTLISIAIFCGWVSKIV